MLLHICREEYLTIQFVIVRLPLALDRVVTDNVDYIIQNLGYRTWLKISTTCLCYCNTKFYEPKLLLLSTVAN